ncbi:hypothetical protein ACFRJ9_04945 [Paenarthrobacter sp. NPDC056912]|uniref:hypothetical protein n=1 Tax=Paenarthrobacter sp. NPDC056912 TaxID=3345965 RepID=UPI00366A9F41
MDLRDAARKLYAAMPRDFIAERTALARTLKEAGNKDLAQEIGGLPKPAAAAWAINMLALHRPEVIDGVVRFGAALRSAQEESDVEAFRGLSQQRQGQLTSAVNSAKDLASELGGPLSASAAGDVEQTLRAAMADAGAAAAVRTGRLVRGLSGSGFESVDVSGAIAAAGPDDDNDSGFVAPANPAAKTEPTPPAEEPVGPKTPSPREEATSLADRRAEKRQAALAEARRDFDQADHAAREAEATATKAWEAVNELAGRRSEVQAGISDAKKRLASLEAELIGITRDADAAEAERKIAVRAATQQRRAADQTRRRIDRLT